MASRGAIGAVEAVDVDQTDRESAAVTRRVEQLL
jgi:hypothetical protein